MEVNGGIAARDPQDVQIQLDLAKCHTNLGELLRGGGELEQAIASYQSSCAIAEKLVKEHPDQPRYREQYAGTLGNLALALSGIEPAKGEESFQKAISMYEKLVADYKENFDYRLGLARCLQKLRPATGRRQTNRSSRGCLRQGPGLGRDQRRASPVDRGVEAQDRNPDQPG